MDDHFRRQGIRFNPVLNLTHIDPGAKELTFKDGRQESFNLLAGVPPHRSPRAVRESALANEAGWVANAIVFIFTFLVFVLVWLVIKRLIRPILRRAKLDETALSFTETILKYTILTIGALNALTAAGVNTSSVLASLGIAGLTIGFAARDAFANLIPDYMLEPPPRVVVTGLNDYNVAVALQAWISDERTHVEKRFELREKIFNALNEAGVQMPFETIQIVQ